MLKRVADTNQKQKGWQLAPVKKEALTNNGVHQSDWSKPVGRPYTSWMATLKSDLSLHNLTFEDAIELALDKSLWRLLVASRATHGHGACRIMMMMMNK